MPLYFILSKNNQTNLKKNSNVKQLENLDGYIFNNGELCAFSHILL